MHIDSSYSHRQIYGRCGFNLSCSLALKQMEVNLHADPRCAERSISKFFTHSFSGTFCLTLFTCCYVGPANQKWPRATALLLWLYVDFFAFFSERETREPKKKARDIIRQSPAFRRSSSASPGLKKKYKDYEKYTR